MAITTTTVKINAGWGRTDVIGQLEQAFTWLGWHGDTQSGIVTGIVAYSGGGTVGSVSDTYEDVRQVSSSGNGTGASFYITRSNGNVNTIYVNRPGVGYANGEIVQLSAEDIGGSSNGAVGIAITVAIAGGASPVGYGSTTAFYDKDVTTGGTYPWGVLRHTIQQNKKFGDTYRGFQLKSNTTMNFHVGSSFYPWDNTSSSNRNGYYPNRFAGASLLDRPFGLTGSDYFDRTSDAMGYTAQANNLTFASSTSYDLDLNIFRSSLDPNFAVLSYRHPYLSTSNISQNTFLTFFVHNFTTSLWDLDNLFLGGFTQIIPGTDGEIEFRTYLSGSYYTYNSGYPSKRCAEYGYDYQNINTYIGGYKSHYYKSNSYPDYIDRRNTTFYLRDNSTVRGSANNGGSVGANANFNAVIKGLPINGLLVPTPYYIPDEFVMIDFDYAAPATNIQQGDTITISPSEIYKVITGSYNQTTRTRGLLFCARVV